LAGGRPPRPQLELAAETLDLHDHIVDRASLDAFAGKQTLNVPTAGGRAQAEAAGGPGGGARAWPAPSPPGRRSGPVRRTTRPRSPRAPGAGGGTPRPRGRWSRPRAPAVLGCTSRRSAPSATGPRALTACSQSCQPLLWPDPTRPAMLGDDTPETRSLAPSS